MKRIKLLSTLSFSEMIQGFWRAAEWNMSKEERLGFIEACLDLGVTTFDHADIYGNYSCEQLFGEALALKPSLRDRMEIVTKCGIQPKSNKDPDNQVNHYNTGKERIIMQAEQSLKHFGINEIDVLLIHRPDPFMDPGEVAEAFYQLHKEGKVKHFGVSNFLPSSFNMLQSYLSEPLVTNQIEVSPLQLEHFGKGTIDLLLEKRIKPMIWSPLSGGRIFREESSEILRVRKTLQEIAEECEVQSIDIIMYAWLLIHPAGMMPIIGSGKIDRVKKAVEACEVKLNRQQWFRILESAQGHPVP